MPDPNPGGSEPETSILLWKALVAEEDPGTAKHILAKNGFVYPARTHKNLMLLSSIYTDREYVKHNIKEILDLCGRSPNPDASLNNLERFARARGGIQRVLLGFERNPVPLERLLWILGASDYFADVCIRDPEYALELFWNLAAPRTPASEIEELQVEPFHRLPHDRAVAILRRAKRRAILRIGARDYLGLADLEASMADLSDAADAILDAAFRIAARRVLGAAAPLPPLCILAMGKLGGRELNYSSDVDLVFLHDDARGPRHAPELFQRLGEAIVSALSEVTEDGCAFRVDVRLRPHGIRGPLSLGVLNSIDYYHSVARPWERVSLVRARPAAGALALGRRFLEAVEPIVFPRTLSAADLEALRTLKRRSESEFRRRLDPERDLKGGPGGIRDVEFVVQTLCVLHGGAHPALRTGNVLRAIRGIRELRLLPGPDLDALESAYRFLRASEHRVQTLFSISTHEVPRVPAARAALARSLRFRGADADACAAFDAALALHRRSAREILERFLGSVRPAEGPAERLSVWLAAGPADAAEGAALLAPFGFRDPARAAGCLLEIASPASSGVSTPERLREGAAALAPRIAERLAEGPDPDGAVARLSRILTQAPAPATLLETLRARPAVLDALAGIAAASPFLAEIPAGDPSSLEPLLLALAYPKGRIPPASAVGSLPIRSFRAAETLRIGARDLLGLSPPRAAMRALSRAAEAAVRESLARARATLAGEAARAPLAVLALGRLGGREMGYASDLDLVFLRGAGEESFAAALAERLTALLEDQGAGWRVDARLRPGGKSANLVPTLAAFEAYHAGKGGAFWERLALTRARAVAGSPAVARAAEAAAARAAYRGHRCDPGEGPGLVRMRERQEQEAGSDDLKRGPGGLSDVEFLVSYLQILHGARREAVRTPSTRGGIGRLARAGVLRRAAASSLLEGFDLLRLVESRIRIVSGLPRDVLPPEPAAREALAGGCGFADAAAMQARIGRVRERIRGIFLEILTPGTPLP